MILTQITPVNPALSLKTTIYSATTITSMVIRLLIVSCVNKQRRCVAISKKMIKRRLLRTRQL